MLKRIRPPQCIMCEQFNASLESERWPSVKLCGVCSIQLKDLFFHYGWTDHNPFFFEIAMTANESTDDVFFLPRNPDNSYSQIRIKKPKTT